MSNRVRFTLFVVVLLLGCSSLESKAVVVDAVMEWNQIALSSTVTAGQGPQPQARSMTIVHVSVNDAVNTITGRHDTYLSYGPPPAGASAEAAAIAAAHRSLVTLFPSQATALDALRVASLASKGLTEANPGIAVGESIAAGILTLRAGDGTAQAQFPYSAPGAGSPGVWVPLTAAPALLAGLGNVTPWVLHSGSQFRPDGPPALDSERYTRDYNEIKAIGSATSTTRTAEQTEIGRFWLGTPSAIWNGVARQVIAARGLDLSDAARTFALMYMASYDAAIACWDAKYAYNFWRPQPAIRNGHLDGNAATNGDPTWAPLFPTPPHPEYTSGHSTLSSAIASMLGFLFGDNPGVTLVALSPTNPGFPRQWTTFSQGVDEVIEARIYSGIHFRTADEVGAKVGRQVARFVLTHTLKK
jgi:hypothetical protein